MKRRVLGAIYFLGLSCLSCSNYGKTAYALSDFSNHSSEIGFNKILIEEDLQAYTYFPLEGSSPALLIIEGSYTHNKRPKSILRLFKPFERIIKEAKCGIVFMEKQGISPEHFNREKFHRLNTPSQRLSDHQKLLDFLKKNPPNGWNGNFIILGGSEGGPIAIKLSRVADPIACITLGGCGDQTFKEHIWHTIQNYRHGKSIKNKLIAWWYNFPKNYLDFDKKCRLMKNDPSPKKWWFGQTYLYWADSLDQEEKTAFLELNCPVLVIAGSKDLEESSTQRLVSQAEEKGKDVIYKRIEGMGHNVLGPQWKVIDIVLDFLNSLN